MGIDYGLGQTNIDTETGIRYGVINQHDVGEAWYEASEAYYGEPQCPECGGDVVDLCESYDDIDRDGYSENWSNDYACDACKALWDSDHVYPDEPMSHFVDDGEYQAEHGDSGDIFITKSPFYTYCGFCSPCAPGAGYLTTEGDDCKTYCFGHDWFEDDKAPYKVYRVSDNEEVRPCRSS